MECSCYNVQNEILRICADEYAYFFKKANVVGVGLGYKVKNGVNTYEKCIKVFVEQKIRSNNLSNNELIPHLYKGFKTDVSEAGAIRASSLNKKIRPVLGGYNIGAAPKNLGGTFGCLVKDSLGYYMLSNNHIMAKLNELPLGTNILQPEALFGGKNPKDKVAVLSSYIPLKFENGVTKPVNYVDAAIAKIDKKVKFSNKIAIVGSVKGLGNIKLNDTVKKVGATTEYTYGIVQSIGCTYTVEYDKGKALFKNMIITSKMSDSGDSGAILLDIQNYGVGLLVGTGTSVTAYNPLKRVLDEFRVTLVTD